MFGGRPGPSNDLRLALDFWREALNEVYELHKRILRRIDDMPTREEFDALRRELKQAISDAAGRVSADIQSLKDALNNGTPVTQEDLDDLKADVEALGQIDAAPTP